MYNSVPNGKSLLATVRPTVAMVPLAVIPAVHPQHSAQISYPHTVNLPAYVPVFSSVAQSAAVFPAFSFSPMNLYSRISASSCAISVAFSGLRFIERILAGFIGSLHDTVAASSSSSATIGSKITVNTFSFITTATGSPSSIA